METLLLFIAIASAAVSLVVPPALIVIVDTRFVLKAFRFLIDRMKNPNTTAREKENMQPFFRLSGENLLRIIMQILILPLLAATLLVNSLPELAEVKPLVLAGWSVHLLVSVVLTAKANKILRMGKMIRETKIHIRKDSYDVTYDARAKTVHISPQVTTDRSLLHYLFFFTGIVSNTLCPIALYFGKKKAIKNLKN